MVVFWVRLRTSLCECSVSVLQRWLHRVVLLSFRYYACFSSARLCVNSAFLKLSTSWSQQGRSPLLHQVHAIHSDLDSYAHSHIVEHRTLRTKDRSPRKLKQRDADNTAQRLATTQDNCVMLHSDRILSTLHKPLLDRVDLCTTSQCEGIQNLESDQNSRITKWVL